MNPQTFDVHSVPLSKISMVDASAGTGKTYSIALLVIRLILEKDMDIRTILVLTFTKAATREIQGRIQAFLQELHNCCEHPESIHDSPLHTCLPGDAEQRREAQRQIARALLFIDEAPIYTIHGFCQKMLSTHPFETENLFSPVVLEDSAELHTRFINAWWRKCMAHSKPRHLHLFAPHIPTRQKLFPLVSAILAGKEIDPPKEVDIERALTEKEEALSRCEEERQKLCNDEAALEELRAVLIEERAKKTVKFI
ncbi:MAG: UvrD-helicase domain-containing protein [Fibrobacterota bacterium]